MSTPEIEVRRNDADHQFEANVEGGLALMTYHQSGDQITFVHTEVPVQAEGKGIASAIARTALGYAREHRLRVIPQCSYMVNYLKRYRDEYADLVEQAGS
jgi:Predicted acetyltransferase